MSGHERTMVPKKQSAVSVRLVLQPHFIIQSTAFRLASVVTAACIGLPSSTPL